MRVSTYSDLNFIEMTSSSQETSSESRIEKMKKFLSSPLTRKKPSGTNTKTFGAPLDVLIQRTSSEAPVPYIVTRICQYIEENGLSQEGLFRISGNARLIEKLKSSFDQSGDAPLETEGDVASAAALLKLFLRELPDPIIPLSMHQQFLNAVKGADKNESVGHLMHLVEKLPLPNFGLLKYLSYFLMRVSQYEEQNRMSASSLGIVFGPNLFRVAEDFIGLKEQSLTNQIVTYFIMEYFSIFRTAPEHARKSDRLSISFESVKSNHITLDANYSMVASWPKVSSFPTPMPSINLRPLSVSIPMAQSIPGSAQNDVLNHEAHILMMDDSSLDEGQIIRCKEVADDDDVKEEPKSNASSMRRKRKVKDTSNSSLQQNAQEVESQNNVIVRDVPVSQSTSVPEMSDRQYGFMFQSKSHSAEKHSHEPVLDPQKNGRSFRSGIDSGIHEAQRSAERTALHISPQQNRSSPKPSLKSNGDALATPIPQPSKFQEKYSCEIGSSSSLPSVLSRSHAPQAVVGEISSLSLEEPTPSRFSYNHKQHYRGKGRRAYYYNKKQPTNAQGTSVAQEVSNEKKEMQLDGLVTFSTNGKKELASKGNNEGADAAVDTSKNSSNGTNSDQRFSWPIMKYIQDGDPPAAASPSSQFLKISSLNEAPLSPSAYRSYLSHRNPHLDPNLPPSPPVEQEDLATGVASEANEATCKQLSKKAQSLKKKIKQLEEVFEASRGYRPSYAEKSNCPEIKKLMRELHQTRQEIKQLKEDSPVPDALPIPQWTSDEDLPIVIQKQSKKTNTCRLGACLGPVLTDGATATVEGSLKEALEYLEEKRKSCQRPEILEDMTREQLVEEKYIIQKLLLQFESIHGRPSSKNHRDLMRPLYDRYRNAKRILGRSISFGSLSKGKDSVELPPILEHETMDFRSPDAKKTSEEPPSEESSLSITEESESEVQKEINEEEDDEEEEEEKEVEDHNKDVPIESHHKSKRSLESELRSHGNLHELSLPELYEQHQQARTEKRRLRLILRDFECQFQKENGRKVQREDKGQMESVYGAYKNIRSRLKLLDALTAKHGHRK